MAEGFGASCQTCGAASSSLARHLEHISRHNAGRAAKFGAYVVNNPLMCGSLCEYFSYIKGDISSHHRIHYHYTLLSRSDTSREEIIAVMLEFQLQHVYTLR